MYKMKKIIIAMIALGAVVAIFKLSQDKLEDKKNLGV